MDWKTGARFPTQQVHFIISKATSALIRLTNLHIQLELSLLSLGIMRQERETPHSI